MFINLLNAIADQNPNKLDLLCNYVSPDTFDHIANTEYDTALGIHENLFVKPTNELFARHLLWSCKQESSQSLAYGVVVSMFDFHSSVRGFESRSWR